MSMDDQAAVHEAIENHRYNPGMWGMSQRRQKGSAGVWARAQRGARARVEREREGRRTWTEVDESHKL